MYNDFFLYSGKKLNDMGDYDGCYRLYDHTYSVLYFEFLFYYGMCLQSVCSTQVLNDAKAFILPVLNDLIFHNEISI